MALFTDPPRTHLLTYSFSPTHSRPQVMDVMRSVERICILMKSDLLMVNARSILLA